jgi:hypothetical protein
MTATGATPTAADAATTPPAGISTTEDPNGSVTLNLNTGTVPLFSRTATPEQMNRAAPIVQKILAGDSLAKLDRFVDGLISNNNYTDKNGFYIPPSTALSTPDSAIVYNFRYGWILRGDDLLVAPGTVP